MHACRGWSRLHGMRAWHRLAIIASTVRRVSKKNRYASLCDIIYDLAAGRDLAAGQR